MIFHFSLEIWDLKTLFKMASAAKAGTSEEWRPCKDETMIYTDFMNKIGLNFKIIYTSSTLKSEILTTSI